MDRYLLPIFKALLKKQLFEDIYNKSLATDFFWILMVVTLSGCLIFYRNPHRSRTWFYKTSHWAITGVITALICVVWSIITCQLIAQKMLPRDENDPISGEYFDSGFWTFFSFGFWIWIISFVFFFLFSIGFRYLGGNTDKTPF